MTIRLFYMLNDVRNANRWLIYGIYGWLDSDDSAIKTLDVDYVDIDFLRDFKS